MIDEVPTADDTFPLFVALAAEVAARDGHPELGAWCADRLDEMGDLTVTIGLGTIVMGFAAHFAGFAHAATGNVKEAVARFDRARSLALDSGADLGPPIRPSSSPRCSHRRETRPSWHASTGWSSRWP